MPAIEIVSGSVTAPGPAITPITYAGGNSGTIRWYDWSNSRAYLISCWALTHVDGALQIKSPRLHDNVIGMQFNSSAGNNLPVFPNPSYNIVRPQDTLTVGLSGSGAPGEVELASMLIYYYDLPGAQATFTDWSFLLGRINNLMTIPLTIVPTVAGNYSGAISIVTAQDQLKANRHYACLGYTCSSGSGSIRITGTDTGNLGVGGPLIAGRPDITANWFLNLSKQIGFACVPVINSANKFSTVVDIFTNETLATANVSLVMALIGDDQGNGHYYEQAAIHSQSFNLIT